MRRDLCNRIVRFERELGLSAQQQALTARFERFQSALEAYETERDRLAGALPAGWRLVMDYFTDHDGHVVSKKHRATNQPPEIENGVEFNLDLKQVTSVSVQIDHVGRCRPPCQDDAKWQAERDRALPEDLRQAISALEPIDFIDYLNHEEFGPPTDQAGREKPRIPVNPRCIK
jgi:hypothetical protein